MIRHSQFAGDTCFFGVASRAEVSIIKKVLDDYSLASGQMVNWDKSEIFFFNMQVGTQRDLARFFEVRIGKLPGKFLGTPLFSRAGRAEIWNTLVEGVSNRMES